MDKTLKNIINKTIEREYQNVMEDYVEHLKKNPQLKKDYEGCSGKLEKVMKELYKVLPKEYQHLVNEFEEIALALTSIESRVAFKEGVMLGSTSLNYLSEVGIELQCI